MSFNNYVVIVTGASSGIGAATAVKFAKEGANVVIAARNEEKLSAVADKCLQNGNKPLIVLADLTNDADVKNIVDTTLDYFGKLDVLVNIAGKHGFVDIASENIMGTVDDIIALNLRAAMYLTNLCAPHLMKSVGNVINISSAASNAVIYPENFAYGASKAALDHFTRCVALDLAAHGVRVNTINPGPVKKDCIHRLVPDKSKNGNFIDKLVPNKSKNGDFWDAIAKRTALGRLIEPEEVADLVLYLASDRAKNITGSSFLIDGGLLLKN